MAHRKIAGSVLINGVAGQFAHLYHWPWVRMPVFLDTFKNLGTIWQSDGASPVLATGTMPPEESFKR